MSEGNVSPDPDSVPARFRTALAGCASGDLPPMIAVMRLLMEATDAKEPGDALADALARSRAHGGHVQARRLEAALRLLRAHPGAWDVVKSVLHGVEHAAAAQSITQEVARWAAVFDRAARVSPEGSVALYSLGEPSLLRAATDELAARLRGWGLLGGDRTLLDVGCGIGRLEEALAPEVGHVIGLDISHEMIALARERCAGLANVQLEVCSGQDFSAIADAAIDVVVSVDAFPYLMQAGLDLVDRHFAEAARVLRPAGSLLVLNFSYRGDPQADRADIGRLAACHGFTLRRNGTRDFTLWDGLTFHMQKRP